MTQKFKNSLEFVARYYREGAFRPTRHFVTPSVWRRPAVAASIAAGVLAASAGLYAYFSSSAPASAPVQVESPATRTPVAQVRRIEFTDVPLARVALEIEDNYGVKLAPLNDAEASMRLTLSYEGTAADLVSAINELLGTHLTIITPDNE